MANSSDEDVDTNSENEFPTFPDINNFANSRNPYEFDNGGDESPSSIVLELSPIIQDDPRSPLTSETTDMDFFAATDPGCSIRRAPSAPFDILNEGETPVYNQSTEELNDLIHGLRRRKRRIRFDLDSLDDDLEIPASQSSNASLGSNATTPNMASNLVLRPRGLYRAHRRNLAPLGARPICGRLFSPPNARSSFTGASTPLLDSDDDVVIISEPRFRASPSPNTSVGSNGLAPNIPEFRPRSLYRPPHWRNLAASGIRPIGITPNIPNSLELRPRGFFRPPHLRNLAASGVRSIGIAPNNLEYRPSGLYRPPQLRNRAALAVRPIRGRPLPPSEQLSRFIGASIPFPPDSDDDDEVPAFERPRPPPRERKPHKKRSPAILPPLPDYDDDDDEVLFPEPTDSRFVLPGALREIEQPCRLSETELFVRSELVIQVLMLSLSKPVKDADTQKDNYRTRICPKCGEVIHIYNSKESEHCKSEEHK